MYLLMVQWSYFNDYCMSVYAIAMLHIYINPCEQVNHDFERAYGIYIYLLYMKAEPKHYATAGGGLDGI